MTDLRHPPRFRGVPILAACASLVVACGTEPRQAPSAPPPPEVTVAHPLQRDVTEYQEFTGRLQSVSSVEVVARVVGVLEQVLFSPSSYVQRGDLLFTIEAEQYVAARNVAAADIIGIEAGLASARSDLSRLEQAIQTNAVSEQEVDRARAAVNQAEANLLGAQARLAQAELDVAYTEVHSPISGMISRTLVTAGNLVGAGSASTPLATVTQLDPIHAYFGVSEALILGVLERDGRTLGRPGVNPDELPTVVHLGLADEEGWPHDGQMDYIDNTVDPSTGTVEVRGTFPNPTGKLFPGLFARIRLPSAVREDALLVSERAIGTDLGGRYLLVVGADDIVELRHVELGSLEGGFRVVTSGLGPTERYIVNGLLRARPGLPVTPTMADAPPATNASPSGAGPARP